MTDRPLRIDAAWLAAFRVLFGCAMCVSMLRFIAYDWIDAFFVAPQFHFKYWGFSWIQPLSASAMHALFWLMAGAAALISLGLYFRVAACAFTLGFAYLQLIDVATYLNHYYLANLLGLLLACSPAGRSWSLDALRKPAAARAQVSRLWLYLFRFQVAVVYTFAGLAKAHADWLVHAEPLRIWLSSRTELPLIGPLFRYDWSPLAMSWAGFAFDSSIVWFLMWRRTRPYAFALVVVFHALTRALFPIGMFPVIMVMSALVFFPPDWPRAWLRALAHALGRERSAQPPDQAGERAAGPHAPNALRRFGLVCAALYCLVQVALPLRFLTYGGDVRWHEQGMRLSWRVMVREKNGSVLFLVRDPGSGRVWEVSPRRYLTRLQEREMSGQPDLILQLAQHIQGEFAQRLGRPVEVRADATVSLNGRKPAPLIDPTVDLSKLRDGLGRASWILPCPTEPPPHIRAI